MWPVSSWRLPIPDLNFGGVLKEQNEKIQAKEKVQPDLSKTPKFNTQIRNKKEHINQNIDKK